MLDLLKQELVGILQTKHISLIMLFQREGHILWHRGRSITGTSVISGLGFPTNLIRRVIETNIPVDERDQLIFLEEGSISESARKLLICQILIIPLDDIYLYIDSGCEMHYSDDEIKHNKILAGLLQKAFQRIVATKSVQMGIDSSSLRSPDEQIRHLVLRFAIEDDCVLLTGETGSGKTHMAEQIHLCSGRGGAFVVCDTTTLNQELMESELFGHKKGAFTGAVCDKRGLVDMAHKGTLFLDEIAEVPLSFQVRLMRFIETRQYRVLGDPVERQADVRIIAATNRNLKQMVSDKSFREDLFYRLNIFSIHVPPLRERKDDIKRLVNESLHFLKGKSPGDGFWAAMEAHDWPGNIRELKTVLKRLGVLCDSPIQGRDVKKIIDDGTEPFKATLPASVGSGLNLEDVENASLWQRFSAGEDFWQVIKTPFLKRELSRKEVRSVLLLALSRSNHKFINCLPLFNLKPTEYKPFMKFLIRNNLNMD